MAEVHNLEEMGGHTGPPSSNDTQDKSLSSWIKVAGCFVVFIESWGIATSFGAWHAYYQLEMFPAYSPSSIAWIGTVQAFLLNFTAIVAGYLYDRGYAKSLLCIGSLMVVLGHFMLSLAGEYWQVVLCQGVCVGLGSGLLYVPAVTMVSQAFDKARPIALGISASGSAVGGTVIPIMFNHLVPAVGFAWTNRILAFALLATSIAALVALLAGSNPDLAQARHTSQVLDASAFRDRPFLFLCGGLFLVLLGFWIPPFTITPFAKLSLHASADYAYYLLAIMNAGGFAGRILPPFLTMSKFFSSPWVLTFGCLGLAVLVLCWIAIHNLPGITIWAVLVGFTSGIAVSMPNAVLPELSPMATLGTRSGMMWTIVSFAALIGTPIAEALVPHDSHEYLKGQVFSGLSLGIGALLLSLPAVYVTRRKLE